MASRSKLRALRFMHNLYRWLDAECSHNREVGCIPQRPLQTHDANLPPTTRYLKDCQYLLVVTTKWLSSCTWLVVQTTQLFIVVPPCPCEEQQHSTGSCSALKGKSCYYCDYRPRLPALLLHLHHLVQVSPAAEPALSAAELALTQSQPLSQACSGLA